MESTKVFVCAAFSALTSSVSLSLKVVRKEDVFPKKKRVRLPPPPPPPPFTPRVFKVLKQTGAIHKGHDGVWRYRDGTSTLAKPVSKTPFYPLHVSEQEEFDKLALQTLRRPHVPTPAQKPDTTKDPLFAALRKLTDEFSLDLTQESDRNFLLLVYAARKEFSLVPDEEKEEYLAMLKSLPQYPKPQGNSQTNIYGNGNNVTTDVGANGWTPTVNTGLGDGPVSSSVENPSGRPGGATGSKSSGSSGESNKSGSRYQKWWEPIAAKALDRGIDKTFDVADKVGDVAGKGLKKLGSKLNTSSSKSRGNGDLYSGGSSASSVGNIAINSETRSTRLMAYPPAQPVPIPPPDDPSVPGPSGDRLWLLDTFEWTTTQTPGYYLAGQNGLVGNAGITFPPLSNANWGTPSQPGSFYPLPWAMMRAQPQGMWNQMHGVHSLYNCGWRATLVVNGTQFHAGCLVVAFVPESFDIISGVTVFSSLFVYPYVMVNLFESNSCTIEVPYAGPAPNSDTLLHANWTLVVMVLNPLVPPPNSPNSLSVSLYVSPLDTTFHGLRFPDPVSMVPQRQHWKTRFMPGAGAFGTAVAGQEIPLCGVRIDRPPVAYLPAEVRDWLEFCHRPGLIKSIGWTDSDQVGSLLFATPVSPYSLSATQTPMSFVMSLFTQWRGSLMIHLQFVGSVQHYGRLAVCYSPVSSEPPKDMSDALQGTTVVWDIGNSSTLDFTIPFISATYWKTLNVDIPGALTTSLGYFSVWVQSPLVAPLTSPPIAYVNGYLTAGEDFQLRLQQNPALGVVYPPVRPQADDNSGPTHTSSIEDGSAVATAPQPEAVEQNASNECLPDTNLERFFSFFRVAPLGGNNATSISLIKPTVVSLAPSEWTQSPLGAMLSCFTYWAADLRVNLRGNSTVDVPFSLLIAFLPSGATLPSPITPESLSSFFCIDYPVPETRGTFELTFSLPYTSPYCAFTTRYLGWEDFSGESFGWLNGNSFGTLVFYPFAVGPSPAPVAGSLDTLVYVSLGGFRAWCPRATPTIGSLPAADEMIVVKHPCFDPIEEVEKPIRRAMLRRQGDILEPQYDLSEGWNDLFDWEKDVDWDQPETHLDDRVYIIKAQRPTYVHWALRKENPRGLTPTRQISLSRDGLSAIVAYEPPEGDLYQEVFLHHWQMAVLQVGHPYPYNALSNCTTWVSELTGVRLQNTGSSLALGLGLLGCAAIAGSVIAGVQSSTSPSSQGLFENLAKGSAAVSSVATQENVDNVIRTTNHAIHVFENANIGRVADQLATSADSLHSMATSLNLPESTENIREAAKSIADSADNVSAAVTKLASLLESFSLPTQSPSQTLISLAFSWIAKAIGYVMVIFGSPTPLSIAGVIMLLMADASPAIVRYFTELGNPLAALFNWIASKFGLSPSPESCAQAAAEVLEPEPQGIRDFNDTVNAMKNAEWLFDKILACIEKLLVFLGVCSKTDPGAKVAAVHDEVTGLYTDSINAINASAIKPDVVKAHVKRCTELLQLCSECKSSTHTSLLSQALKNYSQALADNSKQSDGPRPEPVVLYLCGKPGSGKSVIASLLSQVLAQRLSGDANNVYSPSSADCQFYDGYTGQCVHFIDDVGQDPEGRDWKDFPNLVSTAPFIVPMASLEKKGLQYTSKVIIATSNFTGPNDRAARCMAAINRRLHIKLCVEPGAQPFDVDAALTPDGPPTRHFGAECPLVRLEANSVRFMPNTLFSCQLDSLDDIVDLVLQRVEFASRCSSKFSSLLPVPQGDVVESSVPTDFDAAVGSNKPIGFLEKLWSWRKPLFALGVLGTIVSLVTGIIGMVKLLRNHRSDDAYDQGAYAPRFPSKPKPKPSKHVSTGVPRHMIVRQGLPSSLPKIADNVVEVSALSCNGTKMQRMCATFLYGRVCVTAAHLIEDTTTSVTIGADTFSLSELSPLFWRELVALFLPRGREYKNLLRFHSVTRIHPTGVLVAALKSAPLFVRFSDLRVTEVHHPGVIEGSDVLGYKASTYSGLCGAALMTDNPGGVALLGIHVAGVAGHSGFSTPLSLPFLQKIVDHVANAQSLIVPTGPANPPVHVPRRTAIVCSPAYGAYPVKKEPAPLTRKDRRIQPGLDFEEQIFLKHGKGDVTEPWPFLEAAFDFYFAPLRKRTFPALSMSEAINGTVDMEGLDMNQSSGYPWISLGRNRRSLFDQQPDGSYQPKPELVESVNQVLANPGSYYYTTFLKDELRPVKKVEQGLTRLVEGAPLQAIIAGRMLVGNFIAYMQNNPGQNGCAVGCNPDLHWTEFYHDFTSFSEVFDLDYKCFDATLPTVCFQLLADRVAEICPAPGVREYIMGIQHSHHVYGRETYDMVGGNPSGCVGTSIWNSIINNCVLLSALMSHPDFSPRAYKILAYGDDILYATEPVIHPEFVRSFYQKHTPLVVTPANKGDTFPEHSSIFDVTFLKRAFIPDDRFPFYIHPVMEADTYEQAIMYSRGGPFQSTVDSLSYLAFHSGPKTYQSWVDRVTAKCHENGFTDFIFLPYSFLQEKWIRLVSA